MAGNSKMVLREQQVVLVNKAIIIPEPELDLNMDRSISLHDGCETARLVWNLATI